MGRLSELDEVERAVIEVSSGGLYRKIVEDVPVLKRGQVWCRTCGATLAVDAAACLRSGWPKCCGKTMSIDDPGTRS